MRPASIIRFMLLTTSKLEPASWKLVMPFDDHFLIGQLEHASSRASRLRPGVGVGSPAPRRISRDAVSRSSPVGLPALSFRISPPFGIRRVFRDVRELERLRIRERRVAARVRQDHGIVRRDLVERRVRRKSLDVRRAAWTTTFPDASRGR